MLLIIQAAGGVVGGRTVIQKLAYFCALELGAGFSHRPHFYGPYSGKVEDALGNAVLAGELVEAVHHSSDWHGGRDVLKYTYTLDEGGEGRVRRLITDHPYEWERISGAVGAIKGVLPDLDQKTLSSAAKTYLIISESDVGVRQEEIPSLARRLGWDLDAGQVESTVALLDRLGLLLDEESD